jgi:hypothetical protein
MAHLFNSGRRCVPSLGSLALASVRHAPTIYRTYVALTHGRPAPPAPKHAAPRASTFFGERVL